MRCGELCKSCGVTCGPAEDLGATIECPACNAMGCAQCDEGWLKIDGCPRRYIGQDIVEAVNVAGMCRDGYMPVHGGLMDQSAWFIDLWQSLNSDTAEIEAEQMRRDMK